MISIKRFLEQRRSASADMEAFEASLQMSRLLIEAIATHVVRGRDADLRTFVRTLKGLLRKMDEPPSPLSLLEVSSEAAEALETYTRRTADHIHEQNQHMQSMVAMLTDTVADISGQADSSVARLQAIEQQIERASSLDDMGELTASLQSCLAAVREASAQQRRASAATVQGLRDHIDLAQKGLASEPAHTHSSFDDIDLDPELFADEPPPAMPKSYVAAFKLQRAEHIALRFGDQAKYRMLSLLSQSLKTIAGPKDRLLRWKATSFVMFLESAATIQEVRALLAGAVAATGQHYIEVGKKTALLSVGVDWTVFPQAQCGSLDAVFTEVDSFLAGEKSGNSRRAEEKSMKSHLAGPHQNSHLAEEPDQ